MLSQYMLNYLRLATGKKSFGYVESQKWLPNNFNCGIPSMPMLQTNSYQIFRLGRPMVRDHSEKFDYSSMGESQALLFHTQ